MTTELSGKVISVKKYVDGSIDVIFLHNNKHTKFQYNPSSNNKNPNFPKELIQALASSGGKTVIISFNENHMPTSVNVIFEDHPPLKPKNNE